MNILKLHERREYMQTMKDQLPLLTVEEYTKQRQDFLNEIFNAGESLSSSEFSEMKHLNNTDNCECAIDGSDICKGNC